MIYIILFSISCNHPSGGLMCPPAWCPRGPRKEPGVSTLPASKDLFLPPHWGLRGGGGVRGGPEYSNRDVHNQPQVSSMATT